MPAERQSHSPQLLARAEALASLPRDRMVAAIAAALAGEPAPGVVEPGGPGTRAFLARLRKVVSAHVREGRPGLVLLDQSALACPGLPWHVAVDGDLVLDGRHALAVPETVVNGLNDCGWVGPVPGRDARLMATPLGARGFGTVEMATPEAAPAANPSAKTGLRRISQAPGRGRIAA